MTVGLNSFIITDTEVAELDMEYEQNPNQEIISIIN